MRLTPHQISETLRIVREVAGDEVGVLVYGSRSRDDGRGGDLDLVLQCNSPVSRMDLARMTLALEAALQLPVDLLVHHRGTPPTPFQRIALAHAVALELAA